MKDPIFVSVSVCVCGGGCLCLFVCKRLNEVQLCVNKQDSDTVRMRSIS